MQFLFRSSSILLRINAYANSRAYSKTEKGSPSFVVRDITAAQSFLWYFLLVSRYCFRRGTLQSDLRWQCKQCPKMFGTANTRNFLSNSRKKRRKQPDLLTEAHDVHNGSVYDANNCWSLNGARRDMREHSVPKTMAISYLSVSSQNDWDEWDDLFSHVTW